MFHPLVSIVIPVYNGANYLREAIDSALAQTYDNFEVLVINDGSDDNGATERIALSYGERIRYFAKANGGVASALNLGIQEMRGEYFSWLSHDDVYMPNKLERQVAWLAGRAEKNVLLFSDYMVMDAHSNKMFDFKGDHQLIAQKPLYAIFRFMINGCTCLMQRAALLAAGLFREDLPATQDYDLWFRLSRMVPLCHMPEVLLCSRQHKEQGMHSASARQEAERLWIRLLSQLGDEEILGMEPSRLIFFCNMGRYCQQKQSELGTLLNYIYQQVPHGRWRYYIDYASCGRLTKDILRALGLMSWAKRMRSFLRERFN